ncbi:hypothetical protein QZH41_016414 [Actinostola sp. cb2023]|nr:hypothetical protein QZH41_016414 [Actinostola sp. cb2023]
MDALERRAARLREDPLRRFLPEDIYLLSKKQQKLLEEWCDQVPVLGFNSGRYDLNLIHKFFVEKLTEGIEKCLGPGTSYDKWVKAYGCEKTKSWFPYEWFDSADKLDHPGLPDYEHWWSKLKGQFLLSHKEWLDCKKLFQELGHKTLADWLRYYNDLDVGPFVEVLVRMRGFYSDRGVDIFKDAVSLPEVSLQFLLRRTLSQPNAPVLHAPKKEAYDMLKARMAEVGKTRIRSHQYPVTKVCKKVVGYDANALYLSTMALDMPCGKEEVFHYEFPAVEAKGFTESLLSGSWFGFAEVDIEVPPHLWGKFEEIEDPPVRANPPLYVDHGLRITAVHRTIEYRSQKIFEWFVDQVTAARRHGDVDKTKTILGECMKLLGNSAYGKLIEALERHTKVSYTKDEAVVDRALRSAWFKDLDEIGDAYEIEIRKARIEFKRPFQVGIAVYQLAKLRMFEFYYDFVDKFVDRHDFELIQMDTNSLYIALSASQLEDCVCPALRNEFDRCRNQWVASDTWSKRTPGIFKVEFQGLRAIAVCSKCYFVESDVVGCGTCKDLGRPACHKHSAKGMSTRHNALTWERYQDALDGTRDLAKNRGFRMVDGTMCTYQQEKLGLSAYYDKRCVLPDGIHTEPLEYALRR